jgi:DNA-binding GntR family transcriptional regulator
MRMVAFDVRSRNTLADGARAQLRDASVGGRLKPDAVLHLHSLAEEPGVRTMPDPDALVEVEDEGVIIGKGMRSGFHDPPTPSRGLMRSTRFAGASA